MTVSSYLYKKYSLYSKVPEQKVFNVEMVQNELLCNNSVAKFYIKDILGKGSLTFNYFAFEKVVCSVLDLES